MSAHNPLADLCLSIVYPYQKADCELSPLRVTFRRSSHRDATRSEVRREIGKLWIALKNEMQARGDIMTVNGLDLTLIGWMTVIPDARIYGHSPEKATVEGKGGKRISCNLLACLPRPAGSNETFRQRLEDDKEKLLTACPMLKSIHSGPDGGWVNPVALLDDPFREGLVTYNDIVIVNKMIVEDLPRDD